jgi:metal-responsive CopG/Arc/MetJ family transcriptional regulator
MSDNPEQPIRKTVSLPAKLWQRIEDYQFQHWVKRDAEAVRQLIQLGLDAAEKQQKPKGRK